jgi:hypothetical protein
MSSFAEGRIGNVVKKKAEMAVQYNQSKMTRTYPKGTRGISGLHYIITHI